MVCAYFCDNLPWFLDRLDNLYKWNNYREGTGLCSILTPHSSVFASLQGKILGVNYRILIVIVKSIMKGFCLVLTLIYLLLLLYHYQGHFFLRSCREHWLKRKCNYRVLQKSVLKSPYYIAPDTHIIHCLNCFLKLSCMAKIKTKNMIN